MSEQDRVRALLDEGKISQEEAADLLDVLGDEEETGIGTASEDAASEGANSEGATQSEGEREDIEVTEDGAEKAVADPPPPLPPPAPAPPDAPDTLRWVRVFMLAGNLEVWVDEGLEHPVTEGEVKLTQEGQNYVVRQTSKVDFLNNLMNSQRIVELTLPVGYGVDLDMKGGNVDLHDVPFLKGKMMAGNVDAQVLGGIQLNMRAGNLDASLRLTEGKHRLDLKAGNGELRFLPGSSVTVSGEVKVGGVETRGGAFVFERAITGGKLHGAVGAGRASLEISQTAGNLELAVEDA